MVKSKDTPVAPIPPTARRKHDSHFAFLSGSLSVPYSLWLSGYQEDKPLVTHVKTLNAARKAAATANKDFYTTPVC